MSVCESQRERWVVFWKRTYEQMLQAFIARYKRRRSACRRAKIHLRQVLKIYPHWGTIVVIAEEVDFCVVQSQYNREWFQKPPARSFLAVPDNPDIEIRGLSSEEIEKYGIEPWL